MKKLYYLIVLALILGLVLTGCTLLSNIGQVPTSEQSGVAYLTKNPSPPGLVALWHLDGNALDSSGNGNDGTLHNFVSPHGWVPGMFGQALSFDGSDDYVDCGTNVVITTAITIEAWINPNAFTNYDAIVANFVWPTNPEGYSFRVMANGKLVWRAVLTGNSTYSITSDSTMEADNWYHVVLTHDANYTRLYINASLDKEETPGGTIVNLGKALKIGYDDYAGDRVFNGIIDEVRIWDKALQPEDILNPDISVEKSGPESAHVGDNITYTYTVTNTGYVPLSDVTVSDDLAGNAEYVSGDTNGGGLLDLEETWIYTIIDYIIPVDAPEYLCNIATAEGWYEEDWASATSNEVCIHTMGARTIGYWKNHSDNWCAFPRGSMFFAESSSTLLAYFPGNGIEEDGVNPLEMLRAQLIAAELNYACFEDDFHYTRYEAADIFGTMRDAEALLQRVYGAASGEDLNAFWSGLSKKQQKNVKQIANPLKDTLEEFNAMGDEIFE
jgi:uncharacterized repeat protein (TIGR01451 family)